MHILKKKIILNVIILCFSLSFSLIILEILSRLYIGKFFNYGATTNIYQEDELLGWKYIPGDFNVSRSGGNVDISINTDGFRDKEFNYENNNTSNIIFIGDSVTSANQVDASLRFTSLVEQDLQTDYKTYNFGVDGYSLDQSYLVLKKYIKKIKPKYVFYTFVVNDIHAITDSSYKICHVDCTIYNKPLFDADFNLINKKEKKIKLINKNISYRNNILINFLRNNSALYSIIRKSSYSPVVDKKNSCELTFERRMPVFIKEHIELSEYNSDNATQESVKIIKKQLTNLERFKLVLERTNELARSHNAKLIVIDDAHPRVSSANYRKMVEQCYDEYKNSDILSGLQLNIDNISSKVVRIANMLNIDILTQTHEELMEYKDKTNCTIPFTNSLKNVIDGHPTVCGHIYYKDKILKYLAGIN